MLSYLYAFNEHQKKRSNYNRRFKSISSGGGRIGKTKTLLQNEALNIWIQVLHPHNTKT